MSQDQSRPEKSQWQRIIEADPDHSHRYVQRFKTMAANGADLHGETRFVDAMVPRGSRILDAGCGPGRVGGELHRRGHVVVGVDVDPVLIEAAEMDEPGPTWLVGDLAELDLPARGVAEPFDVIVCAGNVITFLAASTRRDVLAAFAAHLAPEGRAVVGFGAGRGYEFAEFVQDAHASGLALQVALSTWDLRPFEEDSNFLVAIFGRA
ncbi:class I SAM-dependent methyltransferase [Aestuariimicrobium ganziense]|uniref:class I SAM-dependent methyltransferase n=1 Tax=Aestuariimicrobium ganziense TaxID=2773677 RepID=UPI002E2A75CF|nr:class I SAM-dependent methyltransferase [Aestuariimicrobium ganziense]